MVISSPHSAGFDSPRRSIRETQPPAPLAARFRRARGALVTELVIAMSILMLVVIPLSVSWLQEYRLARLYYYQAVAMEIVDGEMEVLVAGEWRAYPPGTHAYAVQAAAATNLPPGRFTLSVEPARLRLEWVPEKRGKGGRVAREAALPATVQTPGSAS